MRSSASNKDIFDRKEKNNNKRIENEIENTMKRQRVVVTKIKQKDVIKDRSSYWFNASNKEIYRMMNEKYSIRIWQSTDLLPWFLDHRLRFELLVGEGPGTWIEVSPRWGHRERYKRQAILYSWWVLGICRAEKE